MAGNLGPSTTCDSCGSVLLICQNPTCGKPFPRGVGDSDARWGSRAYCSPRCANSQRQKLRFGDRVAATKPCSREGCEELAVQRPTESPASFQARMYHSPDCARLARRKGPLSQREERVVRAEARKEQREKRAVERAKPKPPPEPRPLIRDVPVRQPQPDPGVWRPAFLAERDRQRSPR